MKATEQQEHVLDEHASSRACHTHKCLHHTVLAVTFYSFYYNKVSTECQTQAFASTQK